MTSAPLVEDFVNETTTDTATTATGIDFGELDDLVDNVRFQEISTVVLTAQKLGD